MNRSCFLPLTLLLAIFLLNSTANAQNTGSLTLGKDLSLTVGGFLRTDFLMDSRQTSEAAEGLFTFYPLAPSYDAAGKDINANGKVGYAALASRLTTRFFGPQFIGAATQAYIEFDFTSVLSGTSGVRLRQAYMQLDWEKTRLLVGQAWHPLSSNLTPTVIGLNTGAPFWAFNRSPQLRLEHRAGNFLFTLAHVYQADYASPGPLAAVKSSEYQRNTLLPEMTLSVRYGKNFQIGLAGETKTIQPRNFTTGAGNLKYKTSTKLTTFSGRDGFPTPATNFSSKPNPSTDRTCTNPSCSAGMVFTQRTHNRTGTLHPHPTPFQLDQHHLREALEGRTVCRIHPQSGNYQDRPRRSFRILRERARHEANDPVCPAHPAHPQSVPVRRRG
jgi:hypothetical protein